MRNHIIGIILTLLLFICSEMTYAQKFVVVMRDSFEAPLKKSAVDNPNRLGKEQDNQAKRNQKLERVRGFARSKGLSVADKKVFVDGAVGFVSTLNQSQLADLRADPNVLSVVPDFTIQGSRPQMQTRARMQGESVTDGDFYSSTAKASCAVPLMGGSRAGRSNSSVWILDSGVDASHVDLNVNTNTRLSVTFLENGGNPLVDQVGHGTHCAGLVGGKGLGNPGVTGLSPGAEIISLQVLDQNGSGTWSQLILALDHVVKFGHKGDVVLMSLGSGEIQDCENSDSILRNIIQDLGKDQIYVVMSAGNDQKMANQNLPGCINGTNVFTVGALDFTCSGIQNLASYSNLGNPSIDFLAPGSMVFSTFPNNQYCLMSGTSMAAALVAGLVHSLGEAPHSIQTIQSSGFTYPVAGR